MNHRLIDSDKHSVVLFDGECGFCNRSVKFIIRRDRKGHFRFASLQSSIAESVLAGHRSASPFDSIVLIEGERIYTESTAVLRICRKLDGLWKGLYVLIVIPGPIRNAFYRWFAKHRYHFLGKQEACMIPAPEMRKRFLNMDKRKDDASNEQQ
ncbi:thiol-disulfide oxidoreductase DCC family protein [Bacillus songklensis]|uniref:Thiol-disulfide oxidoreductase DCC family protein n=1 Tax=Bacillus songklensis TaxID=1069116 RepID=A0ABV8B2X7_9BACI